MPAVLTCNEAEGDVGIRSINLEREQKGRWVAEFRTLFLGILFPMIKQFFEETPKQERQRR